MTRDSMIAEAIAYVHNSKSNTINEDDALHLSYSGMRIFDAPLFAFGSPNDEIYQQFKSPEIIGDHFILPKEWLKNAMTVISIFLPYSREIREANAIDFNWPADLWLHGRYEGQLFIKEFVIHLKSLIDKSGALSVIPSLDVQYQTGDTRSGAGAVSDSFTSNWSERHVAYACGMGTFGMSKGLITTKGTSGRFCSIITEVDLPKDERKYSDYLEFCNSCGKCISNCPVRAISYEYKNDALCSDFLNEVYKKHEPRYGCGKCQVGTPCESGPAT